MNEVYTLVVTIGRAPDDGLPHDATSAAMVLFAPAKDEQAAVNDAVRLLREAGLKPLEVESYGTVAAREAEGYAFSDEERGLLDEARINDAVIVIDKQVFFGDEDEPEAGDVLH